MADLHKFLENLWETPMHLKSNSRLVFVEQNGSAITLSNKAKISLYKKSVNSGISADILEEVYSRGFVTWNESFGGTPEQFAFDRVNSFISGGFAADLDEDLRDWFNPKHPEGGWKRINSKGEAIGPCAREPGEPKPKCMSNEKRAQLSKDERAAAVRAKRKHDPNAERKGKPINVSNFGKGKLSEDMEQLDEKNVPTSPEKWARAKAQAKSKFDVYPSAYANGWAAKKYKEMGGGWKSVSEANIEEVAKVKTPHEKTRNHFRTKETVELQSTNPDDPDSRFDGTRRARKTYTDWTPGQKMEETRSQLIKRVIKETIEIEEGSPAWQRKEGKSASGGLNAKGIASYRREHPGSKLSLAVTEKNPKGKRAKRRLSFCRRMRGMKEKLTSAETARDPDSRINKSLRKWKC